MSVLMRAVGVYLMLVAVAIPVHFIITPLYYVRGDTSSTAWAVMNWFMALAVAITLAASYWDKRRMDSDAAADLKRYLEANSVFYGTVAVSIVYYWNWMMSLSPGNVADGQFWTVLGAAMPIVIGVSGCRLWRRAAG